MPVVKGGVWTNIEDEILKAAVSKYGLNQWARVSSLLARKTPKQCKARWANWLDPGIRKIEWSKEEDEKLLHLAKLMPTQWGTIAPIVGRTATQCLERYQKLLDEAESRERTEMGLMGPDGGETQAPSADDVRRLRPGELDPDPESKPARPDTVDLDEDEKEMLSEARARLANTQGKKAKRKARERQLEDSRRLALLQKRRELKASGINTKITTVKKGQMDYNADIPFEKAPAPGFYDTREEQERNERQREAYDPQKKQLANKRKGDQNEETDDRKRRKNDKNAPSAAYAAAAKAGQQQKIREAEQSSKRRSLVLPAPQVSDSELDEIAKIGMSGAASGAAGGETPYGLASNYSNLLGATPIRTPRAPQEEDRVANEIKNARARTETQSALLGGENTQLHEGSGSTGFEGVAPSKQQLSTPNPLATPLRQGVNGVSSTPINSASGPGATPMRTPRDNYGINHADTSQMGGQTPRDIELRERAEKQRLRSKLAALPRPQATELEFELPEEQQEIRSAEQQREDAAERDRRDLELRRIAEQADFGRQTQAVQKALPRPSKVDESTLDALAAVANTAESLIGGEMAALIANDAVRFGSAKVQGRPRRVEVFDDGSLSRAKMEIALELSTGDSTKGREALEAALSSGEGRSSCLPGLGSYIDEDVDELQAMTSAFESIQDQIVRAAEAGNKLEQKLSLHLGGYQQRSNQLHPKLTHMALALEKATCDLNTSRLAFTAEEAAISQRLGALREEVHFISRREREAQDLYRERQAELAQLQQVNGYH